MVDLDFLDGVRVVPVLVLEEADAAVPLARALCEAGLRVMEITFRTDAAAECIQRIASDVPDAIVGAGSVRRPEQLDLARSLGARFAVSPGASRSLLDAVPDAGIALIPGATTASEVMGLLERGFVLQKFFPAELAGGTEMLKALGAPLPEVRFFPTGGITIDSAADYLALPNVVCVGGSWITPPALLRSRDFTAIRRLVERSAS